MEFQCYHYWRHRTQPTVCQVGAKILKYSWFKKLCFSFLKSKVVWFKKIYVLILKNGLPKKIPYVGEIASSIQFNTFWVLKCLLIKWKCANCYSENKLKLYLICFVGSDRLLLKGGLILEKFSLGTKSIHLKTRYCK